MKSFALFSTCQSCHKRKLFVAQRYIWAKPLNTHVTSRSLLCGKCTRAIKKMVKS